MMNHRALSLPFLTAFAAALLMAAPASAQTTECQPDDLFCAEVRIGPGSAGIRIGGAPRPLPPPPVVYQPPPQPPVVVVQPAPPPMPLQPPTVVVQPMPPPRVYRPQVVVRPLPRQRVVYVRQHQQPRDRFPYSSTGLVLHVDGLFGSDLAMMGAGGAFRIRPNPHFALDLGAGVYGGNDYNDLTRVEVPVVADALFFFNPQHRFQFYALVGVGVSFGTAEGFNRHTGLLTDRDYLHIGGEAGLGVEWRIGRNFALSFDVRGFLREQVGGNAEPEFRERNDRGLWQETNTSGGVTGRLGMTFYFGD